MTDIIFDCDPGHDDAIAIMLALAHPELFNILGATTVAGNQTVKKVTDNLLRLLDRLGMPFSVHRGLAKPLVRDAEPQPGAHGESGMDGPLLPLAVSTAKPDAIEWLRETLSASTHKTVIAALGPLTNLATLFTEYPEVKPHIEKICLMGGSLYSGNILPRAEFNIYHDPEAAKIVFASGVPIVMSGLEVCLAGSVLHSEYPPLKNGGVASKLAFDLLEFFSRYGKQRGIPSSPIFDMTVIIQLIAPQIFKSERFYIDIETQGELCRGMTVADERDYDGKPAPNTDVMLDVDREAHRDIFLSSLAKLDAMIAGR